MNKFTSTVLCMLLLIQAATSFADTEHVCNHDIECTEEGVAIAVLFPDGKTADGFRQNDEVHIAGRDVPYTQWKVRWPLDKVYTLKEDGVTYITCPSSTALKLEKRYDELTTYLARGSLGGGIEFQVPRYEFFYPEDYGVQLDVALVRIEELPVSDWSWDEIWHDENLAATWGLVPENRMDNFGTLPELLLFLNRFGFYPTNRDSAQISEDLSHVVLRVQPDEAYDRDSLSPRRDRMRRCLKRVVKWFAPNWWIKECRKDGDKASFGTGVHKYTSKDRLGFTTQDVEQWVWEASTFDWDDADSGQHACTAPWCIDFDDEAIE